MAVKAEFAKKYGKHKTPARSYTLAKIKDQSPDVYSADAIMKAASPRGDEASRCDDFVLCSRASVTGIYIVERKEGSARSDAVKQLQAGAKFMTQFISGERCEFLPVLVAKAIPSHLRELKAQKIKLGKLPLKRIWHVKPNGFLPSILPK